MDSRVHVIIAVLAAFAFGEAAGIATMMLAALRRRTPPPAPPRSREQQPGGAKVITLTRTRGTAPPSAFKGPSRGRTGT